MGDFVAGFFYFLPLIILAFLTRWMRHIKINSEIEVEQNKQIIHLLQQIENKIE